MGCPAARAGPRPAPSEYVLMLHDHLCQAGVREACEITLVLPLSSPVPPSPETSRALIAAFAERNIRFKANRRIAAVDAARKVATLDDGSVLDYELFLGVPRHRAPAVVEASGPKDKQRFGASRRARWFGL